MRVMMMMLAIAGILVAGAAGVWAHEDFRVIGTISKREGATISVKSKGGKIASIRIDKQTAISRDGKKIDAAELKAGQTVVVDAYGDSEEDLLALDIRIVPPIGRGTTK